MSGEQLNPQDSCGCCEGISIEAPVALFNRPGLSAIAYRIGTHGEILASLQARLSSQDHSKLEKLRTRDSDDFTIALLDAYACMADVLTFYQERIANESYMRTAGERLSLSEMARLIGYRLKPGVAAETFLAFTMQEPPPQAPSTDPKQASGVPEKITLDIGTKVQSIPGPNEKPQAFETVESVEMRPEWNALKPRLTQSYQTGGKTEAWFSGTNLNLRPGDGLLFMDGSNANWQFCVINNVDIDSNNKRVHVTWASALDRTSLVNPKAYVLRRRAAVFGNNAPNWSTMPIEFKDLYEPVTAPAAHSGDWPLFTISHDASTVDLDSHYPDVKSGDWVVLTTGNATQIYTAGNVSEITRSEFALTAKVTRIPLNSSPAAVTYTVRDTTVYAASEELTIAEMPDESAVAGDTLVLNTQIDGMLPGRTLIVTGLLQRSDLGAEGIDVVTIKSIDYTSDGFPQLTFVDGKGLAYMYRRDTVVIYANVARATHGETVQQTLGNGAASQMHQRFTLGHAPLTYVKAQNETGAEAALEVRVNDILWHEAPTLYNAGVNDRKYVLRTGEDGGGIIQFGDGRRGARLPTGPENVRAIYRKGIGAAGNVKAGQISQMLSRPLGLKAVSNPQDVSGGVDADSADNARRNMPLGVRTLGRVVSIKDYEDFARAFTGIAKAQATVLTTRAGRTVFITVAGDNGDQPSADKLDNLINALKQSGDPLVHCELAAYNPELFSLSLRIKRDPDYERIKVLADVEAALRAAFSFDARDFGQRVSRSEVIAVAQEVSGVLGVKLDNFATITPDGCLVPDAAAVDQQFNLIPAGILLLNRDSTVDVEEMT